MWVGRPTLYGLWRYADLLPESGGVFYHLPVDTRIRVRDGRLKSC